MDNEHYLQLTQFVQLFESNVFSRFRILLLNPRYNLNLVKTLYGILMILPQGKAFNVLNKRIKNIEMIMNLDDDNSGIQNKSENEQFLINLSKNKEILPINKEKLDSFLENFELSLK